MEKQKNVANSINNDKDKFYVGPEFSKLTKVTLDPSVIKALSENTTKPRRHAGIVVMKAISLPGRLKAAITVLIESKYIYA